MKNTIMYFYEFDNFNYVKQNNRYKIEYKGDIYYFYYVVNKLELIESSKLIFNKNGYYKIILNKDSSIISNVGGKDYCLFKEEVKDFDILEEINNYEFINSNLLNRSNWVELWSKKIDYLEYQLLHVEGKYNILSDYIDYFIGLGEVAISYVNNALESLLKTDLDKICLSHKRINYEDYFNPLNVVIDHKARDCSEYLKFVFYNNSYKKIDLGNIIKNYNLSRYGYHLLFGRMLFNSYFFDKYDLIVNGIIEEVEVIPIIKRIEEYECFLSYIYKVISEVDEIQAIDFL